MVNAQGERHRRPVACLCNIGLNCWNGEDSHDPALKVAVIVVVVPKTPAKDEETRLRKTGRPSFVAIDRAHQARLLPQAANLVFQYDLQGFG